MDINKLDPIDWGRENVQQLRDAFWRAGRTEGDMHKFLACGELLRAINAATTIDELKPVIETLVRRTYR